MANCSDLPLHSVPMADLFGADAPPSSPPETLREDAPLADRLRPRALDEVIGQEH